MKKTARVIVTYRCDRKCENCCNEHIRNVPEVQFEDLLEYDEIVITGGEPMLFAPRVVELVHRLRDRRFRGRIWLYTATFNEDHWAHRMLIRDVDGITYTFHAEYTNRDISRLKDLTEFLNSGGFPGSYRLMVDSRVMRDISLQDIKGIRKWTDIKALVWKDGACPVPEHEELLFYDLEKE
ncbi:4Fe-4S cluster-binding domain-containing protein [Lachnospiraceae bacterium 48-42]